VKVRGLDRKMTRDRKLSSQRSFTTSDTCRSVWAIVLCASFGCFVAGCHKRRLNQDATALCLPYVRPYISAFISSDARDVLFSFMASGTVPVQSGNRKDSSLKWSVHVIRGPIFKTS